MVPLRLRIHWSQQCSAPDFRPLLAGCGLWMLLGFVGSILAGGCASTETRGEGPRARDGIAEYRQVAVDAKRAMRGALSSLASLSGRSNECAPGVLSAFSAQMQRFEVESIPLRSRAQALEARGNAYFQQWEEHLARVKDP